MMLISYSSTNLAGLTLDLVAGEMGFKFWTDLF